MAGFLPVSSTRPPALSVDALSVRIDTPHGPVFPVDDVSFELLPKETLAIVGESGCGKTMTARAIMGLLPQGGRIVSGEVSCNGRPLTNLGEAEMRTVRGGRLAVVHQDPTTALDPVMSIGNQVVEALTAHRTVDSRAARTRALELLEAVGVADPTTRAREYPHQWSGGMRQRAIIAMAVANDPDVLIADEPTTALDVTIQAQILQLIKDLQGRTGMSVLLITHDLGVVADIADRILVMYAGQVVESGHVDVIFRRPLHPYTRALLESVLRHDTDAGLSAVHGRPPDLLRPATGCSFRPRCSVSSSRCASEAPALRQGDPGHAVACHGAHDAAECGGDGVGRA